MSAPHLTPRVQIYETQLALAHATAGLIATAAGDAIRERGEFLLVLSGGETPRGVYRQLASDTFRHRIAWEQVHLFFGDERIVPADHPLSTFGMVRTELLSSISRVQVHQVNGTLQPDAAAVEYEKDLESFLRDRRRRFDLVMLGIGEDGHTASLFPAETAPPEWSRPIAAVPGPGAWRVTMTPSLINETRGVVFLASGERKASIVKKVLTLEEPTTVLPASLIRPRDGTVTWLLDRAGGGALTAQHE